MNAITIFLVVIGKVLLLSYPVSSLPLSESKADVNTYPSPQSANWRTKFSNSLTEKVPVYESVAKKEQFSRFLPFLGTAVDIYRNRQTPNGLSRTQTELDNLGSNFNLDSLADQLESYYRSRQNSATAQKEETADAQNRRFTVPLLNFLNEVLNPTDAPSQQPDTNTFSQALDVSNRRISVVESQPMVKTQVWSSIRNFLGNIFCKLTPM